ncbi:MAG: ABC transporter permease [Caldilineae bacterium]|nr:MAG: ABC transporter permease [Caldilineae bacterium]
MSLRRMWTVARKEVRHINRNPLTFFLVAISPAFLLFFLAYVFSFDVEHADLAVMDLDRTAASRRYVSRLAGGEALSVVAFVEDYAAMDALLVAGRVDGGLVIPPGFAAALHDRRPARVQLLVDGTSVFLAARTISMVSAASEKAAVELQPVPRFLSLPFQVHTRAWYNATLRASNGVVPGLLGVVMILPALSLALSLTREKELGTLEGLIATPIRGTEYLLGKLSAYMLMGVVGVLLGWAVAVYWFGVPFRGRMSLLILLTLDFFLASMGFSLLVSTWVSSQQAVTFVMLMVFFVPSFFLTGLIQPVDRQSWGSVLVSWSFPHTHYIAITRALFLKGNDLALLRFPAGALLGMGMVEVVVSMLVFRKRLS